MNGRSRRKGERGEEARETKGVESGPNKEEQKNLWMIETEQRKNDEIVCWENAMNGREKAEKQTGVVTKRTVMLEDQSEYGNWLKDMSEKQKRKKERRRTREERATKNGGTRQKERAGDTKNEKVAVNI